MLYLAQNIARSEAERASFMLELFQAATRKLLLLSTVFWLGGALLVSGKWEGDKIPALLGALLVTGLAFWLAFRLQQKRYLPGLFVWMAATAFAILAGAWLMDRPNFVLLGSFLPLVAVVLINFSGGIITLGAVSALAGLLTLPGSSIPFTPEQAFILAISGLFSLVLGWAVSNDLISVSEWAMASFVKARQDLNEVREKQLELFQAQEDLRLANTELSRLSQRLKILEHIAEEARQAKTEFVANVSHELRTPLNMIIGYTDLIARSPQVYGGRLPASLLTDITAILRNAQHLSALVNDVLDLSQVEGGRMALSRSWVRVENILNAATQVVAGLFQSRRLYLSTQIEPEVPAVYCDETRIRQVIINLLSNAGRFTEQGGVTIWARVMDTEVVISIMDTGAGIAPKDQERIFEPFQQADATIRRRYGGSGLGLTISKQFIEMHGGRMWLESEPGKGTSFSLSLPLETPRSALEGVEEHSLLRAIIPDDQTGYRLRTRRSQAVAPPAGERYVVVDAEKHLARLLARFLPDSEIVSASSLDAAVESLNQSPAQALVVNSSRFDETPPLGRLPFGTPAITCFLPGGHEAARHLGVVEYLIKPLAREKLLETLSGLERSLGRAIKTVLVVNDLEDELHLIARHLKSEERGYSVLQVTSGQRALGMLRTRKPDVMLLDLMMPGMDGFQVLEEKRRDAAIRDIPVIVVSSRDPTGDPIVSDSFTVTHSGGLSQRSLAQCIRAIGGILAPGGK